MQASLQDLAVSGHDNESFVICQRTLLMCHELIFGDLPPPVSTPYPSQVPTPKRLFARKKVKAHVVPAFIGLGMILAGSPGMPQVTEVMGEVAIEQGRTDDLGNDLKSLERYDNDLAQVGPIMPSKDSSEDDDDPDSPGLASPDSETSPHKGAVFKGGLDANGQPISRLARRRTIGAAQTTPALPLHMRKERQPRFSDDPLGQLDAPSPVPTSTPFQSSPSLFTTKQPRTNSLTPADVLLNRYDMQSQILLLRSHFCRSEVGTMVLAFPGINLRNTRRFNFSSTWRTSPIDSWSCQDSLALAR